MKRALFLAFLLSFTLNGWADNLVQCPVDKPNCSSPSTTVSPELSAQIKKPAPKKEKGWYYFPDGRICQDCTALKESGQFVSIKDKSGGEWLGNEWQYIRVDHHPLWRSLALSLAAGGQAYGQSMTQSANQQIYMNRMAPPRNYNCVSRAYSSGVNTNCMGY